MNGESNKFKTVLASFSLGLFALVVFGLLWFFFLGPETPVGFGWYLFSFAAGLSMIVLPCTLPLAFVIVPLSLGKGAAKGFGIAVAFGLGVAITLSMYGVIAAVVGEVAIGTLGAPLETVKNWLYFVAGLFAFLFALGEIGLWKFRMPSYTGAAPAFIQKQQDYIKALLLGLFLGNIGVGCPHPATPVLLTRIAASGDIFYGWMLFFVHAIGRILPLLLLALLAILGVNALNWLVARRERIERATGWGMVFVAGFILVLGLFTHDWWVASGQHTLLEELTQEERFLGIITDRFDLGPPPHAHGPEELVGKTGLLGLPLWLGNWVLVGHFVLPMWWFYAKKRLEIRDQRLEVEARVQPYRFWLFAALSAFFVLTFVYYLPLRFRHAAVTKEEMHGGEMMMPAGGHGETGGVLYHEEGEVRKGLSVNFNLTPVPVVVGTTTRLDFFVNEKPGNVPVPAEALEVEHTKLMHVIGVRDDLNGFFHIHPEPLAPAESITPEGITVGPGAGPPGPELSPEERERLLAGTEIEVLRAPELGILSAAYVFPAPGRYKIWSEIKKDGVNHAFGHPEFEVRGFGPRYETQVSFGRNVIVDSYQVSLELKEPVAKGHEHDLTFDVHTLTGREVVTEPYLAAAMHLTIIKDDWKQFIHTHPEGEGGDHQGLGILPYAKAHTEEGSATSVGEDEVANFHVTFPEPGLYKAFVQFRPAGIDLPTDEALLAEFWIKVEEKAPAAIPEKVLYTAVSLALILLLSWGVKKYLTLQ